MWVFFVFCFRLVSYRIYEPSAAGPLLRGFINIQR